MQKTIIFGHVTDLSPDFPRIAAEFKVEQTPPSTGHFHQPQQDFDQGRFSRSVRAEQSGDSRMNLQGDPIQRPESAVIFGDFDKVNERRHKVWQSSIRMTG